MAARGSWIVTGLPSKVISPLSMAVDAGEALDQGRLAGAVVTDQRGDLAGIDVEVHVVEHVHGAEAFVQLARRKDRFSHEVTPSSVVGSRDGSGGRPGARPTVPPCGQIGQLIPSFSQSDSMPLQISSAFSAPASMTSCTLAWVMTSVGSSSASNLWSGASRVLERASFSPASAGSLPDQGDRELGGRIGLQRDVLEDRHALLPVMMFCSPSTPES